MTPPDLVQLAADAAEVARAHPPRTPGRRMAGHLYAALVTSTSVTAARRAIATFGTEKTQQDAAELLDLLTERTTA